MKLHYHCNIKQYIINIFLVLVLFLLTRQPQISGLSYATLCLVVISIAYYSKVGEILFTLYLIFAYILFSAILAAINGVDAIAILRFGMILLLTLCAFTLNVRTSRLILVALPILFQCFIVVVVAIGLAYINDNNISSMVRLYVIDNNFGDIYTFNGVYYRVQLIGNALIPLFYLIFLYKLSNFKYYWTPFLFVLCALFFAGNLSYLIMCGFVTLYIFYKKVRSVIVILFFSFFVVSILMFYGFDLINFIYFNKFDGSAESSMGVRVGQLVAYYNDVSGDAVSLLFGGGLGSCFPTLVEIQACDANYIELQWLNVLNQIGVIGFGLYLCALIYFVTKFLNKDGRSIFIFYMILSSTNPYIFDMNQIIATIFLVALFGKDLKCAPMSICYHEVRV